MPRPGDTTQVQGAPYGKNVQLQELRDATHQNAMASAEQFDMGQVPEVFGPTQRPMEPVQAGLSQGPGPGPEAMNMGFIDTINGMDNTPDAEIYSQYLPLLEAIASRPGSTSETRNFVRRIRSQARPTGI